MPAWARRFYLWQGALLALAALLLAWVFHATRLDLQLEAPYYDAVNHTFPWRYAWVTKYLLHRYLKVALIVAGLLVWAVALRARFVGAPRFLAGRTRRWWVIAWCFVLVPLASAVLRRLSPMHCPWDIAEFGGRMPYLDAVRALSANVPPGHCAPAGYMTVGTWLLAFALLWYPERRARSVVIGVGLVLVSLALGWVQQMRGAHFLSHSLWSLWWSWLVILAVHAASRAWRDPAAVPPAGPAT